MAAKPSKNLVLKSFNFKLYYTEGGKELAIQTIKEAENSLEIIENFLGARLIEQIDIFLSEQPEETNENSFSRNGNIAIDNSSIYLHYQGSTKLVLVQLKERLAEILIKGMLYGNTIKERLKNNREITVPNWYVPGLAKYVASPKNFNTSWMADYYEGKLKLNLNLINENELGEFGHAVFCYINDSFGINKLRQILFYTKLSGKTDYAFQFVLNKSLNWVISDWFKMEKAKYLKESTTRLPNDPEPISAKLKTADIIQIKFSPNGSQLDFLIRTLDEIELWNYEIQSQKSTKIYHSIIKKKENIWCFVKQNQTYYIAESNGISSSITLLNSKLTPKKYSLDFNYILEIKNHPQSGLAILTQNKFRIDIFHLNLDSVLSLIKITNSELEETHFSFDSEKSLLFSSFDQNKFRISKQGDKNLLYQSDLPIEFLNTYLDDFISFIQCTPDKNIGRILNLKDSSLNYQVTNYTRSISMYDYNASTKKVLEALRYGNRNYVVISDASIDSVKINSSEALNINSKGKINEISDSIKLVNYTYQFITGFEYKINKPINPVPNSSIETKKQLKVREYVAPSNEIKATNIRLGFTNSQYHSPMFAYFLPKQAGINNGPNLIAGCTIKDIYKKYLISASLRQPLIGKGTDFYITFNRSRVLNSFGMSIFSSTYQSELYNQANKYSIKQISSTYDRKFNPRLTIKCEAGYREDIKIPLYLFSDQSNLSPLKLQNPFVTNSIHYRLNFHPHLNYSHKLSTSFTSSIYKPMGKSGVNTNLHFVLKHDQSFFRMIHLTSSLSLQSSIGKQKTVWLLGGVSNWLRPIFGNAALYNIDQINIFSTTSDFEGFPFNYKAGTSVALGKINVSLPINPMLSQQNFNQNIFKFLTCRSYLNLGLPWFGRNPYSIHNPENKDIIETGSMTIVNYEAKNPLLWSWGIGVNSVIFGYEVGIDYSIGYHQNLRVGEFIYLTLGKSF